MFCGVNNHLLFQRVSTGRLCAEGPENDRVELSDTLAATRWPGSSTNPALVLLPPSLDHRRNTWDTAVRAHTHTHLLQSAVINMGTQHNVWYCVHELCEVSDARVSPSWCRRAGDGKPLLPGAASAKKHYYIWPNLRYKLVRPGDLKQRNCFITENTYTSYFKEVFLWPSESWWIWMGFRSLLSSTITTNKQISPGKPSNVMSTWLQLLDQVPMSHGFFFFNFPSSLHTRSTCAIDLAECT